VTAAPHSALALRSVLFSFSHSARRYFQPNGERRGPEVGLGIVDARGRTLAHIHARPDRTGAEVSKILLDDEGKLLAARLAGCLRLLRLPSPRQAALIREVLGLQNRVAYAPTLWNATEPRRRRQGWRVEPQKHFAR
jgi:hypothetical protein